MLSTRNTILAVIALAAAYCLLPTAPASAGPLCNWLFGRRNTSYYVPTGTYVPTATGATVTAGYLPTASAAYPPPTTSYYPPRTSYYPPTTSYRATLPPQGMPVAAYSVPTARQPALPVAARGIYYAGRPTVNPYPSTPAVTAYSPIVGATATAAGNPAGAAPYYWPTRPRRSLFTPWWLRVGSYFGMGSYYPSATPYPTNTFAGGYWSSYRMPTPPANTSYYPTQPYPVAGGVSPATQPYTMNQPIVTAPSQTAGYAPQTTYSTNTYNAPVTYYRPVTTIDPATGQPITTMQACGSTQTQVQRIPSYSLGGALSAQPQSQAPPSCPPGTYECSPAYGSNQYAPTTSPTPYSASPTPQSFPQRPTFGGAATPTYPSANDGGSSVVQPPTVGADRSPVGKPQLSPTTSARPTGSQRTIEPKRPAYLDVKPIPAPSEYRFQYNTTEDRTAAKPARVSTVGYKKIDWAVGRQARRSTTAPNRKQYSGYSESGWKSSAR